MEFREVKILLDLRKNFIVPDLFPSGEYKLYQECQANVNNNLKLFDFFFSNTIGDCEYRKVIFSNTIKWIKDACQNKMITLHILGHGIEDKNKYTVGLEFAEWNFFVPHFKSLMEKNFLFLNLMSTCDSDSFAKFYSHDVLWSVVGNTTDTKSPFSLYETENFVAFLDHLKKEDSDNYMVQYYRDYYSKRFLEYIKTL